MASKVVRPRVQVDQYIVTNLKEVKETIAVELNRKRIRTFGIQDLWNIRKNAKLATKRVRL
jgi:hypothetical protein